MLVAPSDGSAAEKPTTQPAPADADSVFSDALLFVDDPSEQALRRYIQQRPKSALVGRAHFLLGMLELQASRFDEAVFSLELARAELADLYDFISLRLAEALIGGKLEEPAERVLVELQARALDTTTKEDAAEMLAQVYLRTGRREKASETLNDLLVRTPDEPRLVRLLLLQARWAEDTGDPKEALAIYKRVWIYYPHFPQGEKARTLAYDLATKHQLDARLTLDEKLARGRELARLGRDEEAESLLLSVLTEHKKELTPERKAGVLLRRASSALRRKVPEVAVELCELLLKQAPVQSNKELRHDVLRVIGRAFSQLQRYPEAAKVMSTLATESTVAKVKRDSQLLEAVLLRDSGNVVEARKLFQKFIADNQRDPKANDARWFLGWSYYRAGDNAQAQKTWREIIEKNPTSPLIPRLQYWIARMREAEGKRNEAVDLYERVRGDDPWAYYGWLSSERLRMLSGGPAKAPEPAVPPPLAARSPLQPTEVMAMMRGAFPAGLRQFMRASLFWQLGLFDLASKAMRDVPIPENQDDALMLAHLHERLEDHFRGFVIAKAKFGRVLREPLSPTSINEEQRSVLELAYPRAFAKYVKPASDRFSVQEELVYAVMRQESTFKTEAKSWADAQGLLQLIPKTAQRIAREIGEPPPSTFVQPEVNIRLGTAYLARLMSNFSNHPALAAAAYNAGPFSVDQWLLRLRELPFDVFVEEIPFRETRDYVKKVTANFAAYRLIYKRQATPLAGIYDPMPDASKGIIDY
ncbi:MAG: tetratricopeptide repeat protein [Deltaproteobacteria bacterium]|nr:tetratricopeptide repeat protein [Deltaproteobacteria bacterium]